ncbi:DUF5996 family protein [Nocardia sp. NPDC058640]|uniref:DUF5996 family protein n=1 Tax=Nocardia sp. NPDC058640 TaxID=3346571 RepID=UPI0036684135
MTQPLTPAGAVWPPLLVDSWTDTRETLHMMTQIVGKVQMACTPLVNQWWNVAFELSARGIRTNTMSAEGRAFDAEFDFVAEELVLRTSDGLRAAVALRPRPIAEFYAEFRSALVHMEIYVDIQAAPNEVENPIPFAEDTTHHAYDSDAVRIFWQQLVQADRVLNLWRAGFAGKASPVQIWWGGLDMACTLFSGREAPPHPGGAPHCPKWVNLEAYNRQCASGGFWPGGSGEGVFYAYCYPQPDGYSDRPAGPDGAHWDKSLGEFVLPYEVVTQSQDPDATVLHFLQSTYEAAADLANWDRRLFDVNPARLDPEIKAANRNRI